MRKRTYSREARNLQPFIAGVSTGVVQQAIEAGVFDHGDLQGLADDDHTQYLLADGTRDVAGSLHPSLPDTHDLGSPSKMWRKGYLSELDAVLFAQNTITLVGGWLMIGKNEGSLAADVAAAATTVNFGQAMTNGHFVLFRAALKVEYMQVGALVSGTTYNVTRNLDGSGANDWAAGTPYAVLGASGDGRIELNAYDTPRISIIRQGASYNVQTEMVRLGDMNGSFGAAAERYGLGIGDYAAGNYLSYNAEAAGRFVLRAGGGSIQINENGMDFSVYSGFGLGQNAGLRWFVDNNFSTQMAAIYPGIILSDYVLRFWIGTAEKFKLHPLGADVTGRLYASEVRSNTNTRLDGTPGYIFVPLETRLTSTAWDGDARSTTAKTLIDLSAVFSLPAGIKAVLVNVAVQDSGAGATDCVLLLSPNNTANTGAVTARTFPANDRFANYSGIVPCDANGDIYYQIVASGSGTMDVYLEISGYWI